MPGLKIVLPTSFTDTSLPVLYDDGLISTGSLLLVDFAHSARPFTAPLATGAAIPNIARTQLKALQSGATDAQCDGSLVVGSLTGTKGLLERTAKGALHGIVSQSVSLVSGDGAQVLAPAAFISFVAANPSHTYYLSFWDRLTRANGGTLTTNGAVEHNVGGSSLTANTVGHYRASGWVQSSGTGAVMTTVAEPGNVLGTRLGAATFSAAVMTNGAANVGGGPVWGAPASSFNAAVLATRNLYWPSFAAERFYVEDLTISGRTASQVQAIDQALFASAHAVGGRYYADSNTAPSTIA